MLRLGIKYCGGCTPDYDRVKMVEYIKDQLAGVIEAVSPRSSEAELILVVAGCKNACAEIRAFSGKPIFTMTSPADADKLITFIKSGAKP